MLVVAASVVAAAEDSSADDLDHNARLLRKWKADPEHYARLQRDLKAFYALPPERQEQLRQLDRDLHSADGQTQRHLWGVLERYSGWLDRLPESDRKRIEDAQHPEARLKVIRELREQQWIAHLPRKTREDLQLALGKAPEKRAAILQKYREEERQRRQRWQRLFGPKSTKDKVGRPNKLQNFPEETRTFVETKLKPQLMPEQRKHLDAAEGRWPLLVLTVQELARKHQLTPAGPKELWENAHKALPEVPDRVLREFALYELDSEERKRLNLSATDPESRERLTQMYFDKKPGELQRLRRLNKQTLTGK